MEKCNKCFNGFIFVDSYDPYYGSKAERCPKCKGTGEIKKENIGQAPIELINNLGRLEEY